MRASKAGVVVPMNCFGSVRGDGAGLDFGHVKENPAGSVEGSTRKLKEDTPW